MTYCFVFQFFNCDRGGNEVIILIFYKRQLVLHPMRLPYLLKTSCSIICKNNIFNSCQVFNLFSPPSNCLKCSMIYNVLYFFNNIPTYILYYATLAGKRRRRRLLQSVLYRYSGEFLLYMVETMLFRCVCAYLYSVYEYRMGKKLLLVIAS